MNSPIRSEHDISPAGRAMQRVSEAATLDVLLQSMSNSGMTIDNGWTGA